MKTVLFVCVHNSGRSQMAEALLNEMAGGRVGAVSAGTAPAGEVNPAVVAAMKEVGLDISDRKPKRLTLRMIEQADRMITMGCGAEAEAICPADTIKTEDWALDDPMGQPLEKVREIREQVRARVRTLLEEIS